MPPHEYLHITKHDTSNSERHRGISCAYHAWRKWQGN